MQISLTRTIGGALGKRLWSVWLTAAGWFWVADVTHGAQTSAIEAAIDAEQFLEAQILIEDFGRPFADLPAGYEAALESARLLPEGMEEIGEAYQALSIEAETLFEGGDLAAGIEAQESLLMFSTDLLGADHFLTGEAQFRLFQKLLEAGAQPYAEAMVDGAYAIYSSTLGPDHPSAVQVFGQSHWVYLLAGDTATALGVLDAAKTQMRAVLPTAHEFVALINEDQIRILNQTGQTKNALDQQARYCEVLAEAVSQWHPRYIACLNQLGLLRVGRGLLSDAEADLKNASTLAREIDGPQSGRAIDITMQLAEVIRRAGDLDKAGRLLDTLKQTLPQRSEAWLRASSYQVDVLLERAAFAAAGDLLDQMEGAAAVIWQNDPGRRYSLVAKRGELLQRLGDYGAAEVYFQQALQGAAETLGERNPLTLVMMNNLANLYEMMGLYDQAEPLMKQALTLVERVRGPEDPEMARQSNNLALLYESQGSFREAEPLYQNAIEVLERLFGENHIETVALKNNLAFLYFMMNQYERAAPAFSDVLSRWTRTLGEDHPNRLKALNNLGRAQLKLGTLDEAEQTLLLALNLRRSKLGQDHPDVIRSLIDLGLAYLAQGRLSEARATLEDALAKGETILGEQHPYTFEALNGLSDVLVSAGELSKAISLKRQGFLRRSTFLDRMLWVTGENAREGYMRLYRPELMSYLRLLAQVGDAASARLALEASLHRKGLLLKITSEIQQIGRMTQNAELAHLAEQLRESREALAKLTLSGPTPETVGRHPLALYELEQTVNELQGQLGRASAQYRTSIATIDVAALEAEIPLDRALIDFQSYSDEGRLKYLASVVRRTASGLEYDLIDYRQADEVDDLITEYRETIQDPAMEDIDFIEVGNIAYQEIWRPIANVLGDTEYIYLIPDGLLNLLPFAALVDDDDIYLVDYIDFHFLTSGRDLLPSFVSLSEGPYMIVAGPDYDASGVVDASILQQAAARRSAQSDMLRGAGSGLRGLNFLPLPGAQKEGEMIVEQVDAQQEDKAVFSQQKAEERVISELAEVPQILHIATHGFFLKADENLRKRLLKLQRGADLQVPPPGDNPLLRAGLAFAGINQNAPLLGDIDTRNDGVLTAIEVLDLKLSGTKLVVLSACETGLGEIHEGEGVYGLRRAFQEAGVSEVVNSLWEVSDAGTQALMVKFYQRILAGIPARQALRESQLDLKASALWGQPYIWSAFMMVGSYESAGITES
jgi:CHAT domain-containing protein/Tfp pilus assembly protein PilF